MLFCCVVNLLYLLRFLCHLTQSLCFTKLKLIAGKVKDNLLTGTTGERLKTSDLSCSIGELKVEK